jgi:hypothetical protein
MSWYNTFIEHMPEWLVAIFTGTLWLSTLLLWWATRGTLKHAKGTTELDERGYRIDKKRARYHEHGNATDVS